MAYTPKNKIRIVTAASLFDGHDAAINIMRRIMQSSGAEVIHLGHDRSVQEVVNCAIQEDANAIAMTSYQGGHVEYLRYMYDLLREKRAGHIKIFFGGGGVVLPEEIEELEAYGIDKIYSPDDGRSLGLQGMINHLVENSDFETPDLKIFNPENDQTIEKPSKEDVLSSLKEKNIGTISRMISLAENRHDDFEKLFPAEEVQKSKTPVLGITGTGGAGKSSLVDELVLRFLADFKDKTIGIISVDPSKRKTGGALLGDRIRMNAINSSRVYMRSLATRQANLALSDYVQEAVDILKVAEYDLIILETSGIGQSDTSITDYSDLSLYVMTPEYGAQTQLEKIDMLDFADIVALNKSDKRGALDSLRDVRKQYSRNHGLWDANLEDMPVYGTIASQFNDPGMNVLYQKIMDKVEEVTDGRIKSDYQVTEEMSKKVHIIPPNRVRYLSEISENNRGYDKKVEAQVEIAQKLYGIYKTISSLNDTSPALDKYGLNEKELEENTSEENKEIVDLLKKEFDRIKMDFDPYHWEKILNWNQVIKKYKDPVFSFKVRDREINIDTHTESLSRLQIDRKSTRLNSSHVAISYAVFCLKKKTKKNTNR